MNEAALLERYAYLARIISRQYFIPGADRDDVEQEAMFGLWKAIRDFNGEGEFRAFAALCIHRQVITALKTATRLKHGPLTHALREVELEDGPVALVEQLPDELSDPARLVVLREELERVANVVHNNLSPIERRALIGFANGLTYSELGPTKAIDNAIQRARRKLVDPPTVLQAAA